MLSEALDTHQLACMDQLPVSLIIILSRGLFIPDISVRMVIITDFLFDSTQ